MPFYAFEGNCPDISESAYIHPSASVIGNVKLGPECYIGPGAVIRADLGQVCIGSGCAIEDNCIIHVEPDGILIMEDNIIIGHGAIVHGPCLIKRNSVIGMGSIVSIGCELGAYSFLAAGSVLLHEQNIPERTLAAGNPAKIKKPLDEKLLTYVKTGPEVYRELSRRYKKDLILINP